MKLAVIEAHLLNLYKFATNAAFTLNGFDNQERNLTFTNRKRISKFWNSNFLLAV